MSSPVAKRLDTEAQPLILGLADDLLEDILLRVPTLADVGRVATVCRTFRRVIADRSFRRRLRSVHRAPFLGFFLRDKFHPAEAPHPSAPSCEPQTYPSPSSPPPTCETSASGISATAAPSWI
ncbi:hypothetical protein PR202_gb21223 [Eleusine coracana subsp. coracana]|uniref:F-box domain-containing protein n=1 Tax=Eleusine coracana subsp. coracana TaxID=191504 RepID=A0AAV5FEL5_ELECO|nr:hypothetical protein PR202_gb21223 [Eleusine coracana subsp. coracana]